MNEKNSLETEIKEIICNMHIMEIKRIPTNDELDKMYQLSESFYCNMNKLLEGKTHKDKK